MSRRLAAIALLTGSLLLPNFSAFARQSPSAAPATTAAPQTSAPTPEAIERIKEEGLKRSQIMPTLDYLTNAIGPRLTGSPALKRANNWTRDKLTEWGLQRAHLEAWGPFGRGWSLKRFSAEVVGPQSFPLIAYPRAWSPGLNAPLTAEALIVEAKTEEELQKYKGKLRGAMVLTGTVRELKALFDPKATRLTPKELLELADAPNPALVPRRTPRQPTPEEIAAAKFAERKTQFYYEEGVALLVGSSPAGDGGMLQFVHAASVPHPPGTPPDKRVSAWSVDAPKLIPQIVLANDHYNRLARMLALGEQIRLAVNLEVEFHDDLMGYNTIAEIPGADLKDEVVMLGAHLDSWHMATGATDNASGVAIMMEAVRILQALKLPLRRTVRIALWSGEEQGLFGSRAYVREHFGTLPNARPTPAVNPSPATSADPAPAATPANSKTRKASQTPRDPSGTPTNAKLSLPASTFKPEYDKLNIYLNCDGGTGKIRGITLQGNEALRPIFSQWLQPFHEMGASTISVSNAGGSDFLSFDAVGLIGLEFIQDEIEYSTRTWHSNQDTFDRLQPDDLKQAATIVAAFAYHAAMMDQKLPRKPLKLN